MKSLKLAALALALSAGPALAQNTPLRIGVMNDMSSVYADFQGRGSVSSRARAIRVELPPSRPGRARAIRR